jgi:hypothetical protein
MDKNIIVFLDPDGDIVDQVSQNNSSDSIFAVARELTKSRGEQITPYYAKLEVGEKYTDKIHKDSGFGRPAVSVKVPLDECHKHGLCSDPSFRETEFCVLSRCRICPRRDK